MPRPPPLLLQLGLLLVVAAAPAPPPSRVAAAAFPSEVPPAALSAAPNPEAGSPGPAPGWTRNASDATGGVRVDAPNPPPRTQRALTILVLASGALIVYFVIRTVRLRRRNRKTRRYGVLDTNIENELTPLEQDDDEDDTTLFDANHPRR